MLENIIKKYTKNITKNDIIEFALKQNVSLNNDEIDFIYNEIKNNIDYIIKNPKQELIKIKDKLSNTTYLKIKEYYDFYKEKYPDYL